MSIDTEKIAQVSTAMIIVEQANKIKTLEAKNEELEKNLEIADSRLIAWSVFNKDLHERLEIAVDSLEQIECCQKSQKVINKALAAINGDGV